MESTKKTVDRERLGELVDELAGRGLRTVFTNGCFDIIHFGHVLYLEAARRLGDVLFVGVNSDDSVRRLKGPRRPIMSQDERAGILAALAAVDFVAVFHEDTPLELIKAVKPHILVKGGDYHASEVVGRDFVEARGGRLEIMPLVGGFSSTDVIQRITARYRDGRESVSE